MNKISIRSAKHGDERILAYIQTEAWRFAFSDILSAEELEKYSNITAAERMYENVLNKTHAHGYILEVDSIPHCIAFWDKSRDNDCTGSAELICIHSLPDNWRKGCGSAMMKHILSEMKEDEYIQVVLWVFEENMRARRFYEKHGFMLTDKRKKSYSAVEVMYRKTL